MDGGKSLPSHIGRPVDLRYSTNAVIMVWSAIVIVFMFIFRLVSGVEFVQAGITAILAGLTVFFVWTFAREIDPEEQLSAFLSVSLMTVVLFVVDRQYNLIVLFYMMLMSRTLNRTVGKPAKLNDSVLLLIFTGVVGFLGSWLYVMMGATVFLLDSMLPDRNRKHLIFAVASLVIMIIVFIIQSSQLSPVLPTIDFIVGILVTTFVFLPLIMKSRRLTATGDITGEPLLPIRVQATQVIVLLFGYHVALWQGNAGVVEFLPLWITIVGISLFPLAKPFLPDWDLSPKS